MKKAQKALFFFLCGALCAILLPSVAYAGSKQDKSGEGGGEVPYTGEWEVFTDVNDNGNSTINMEIVEMEGMPAYKFTGNVTTKFEYGFVGWMITPDEETLENLKKAKAISFKFVSDGQRETVKYRTSTVTDYAHHEYHFSAEPGEIEYVEVPIKFFQQPSWGTPVRIYQDRVEDVSFQTHESWRKTPNNNPFEITIWDLKIHL